MSLKCFFHPYQTWGLRKGRTFSAVLFDFAELPMHLPQKSLTLPTIPLPSQLPGSSEVGILIPFCLGQPSQQVLQQGKVILVFSHCLGPCKGVLLSRSSALELVWVTWSFSSSAIWFVPIQPPPLHIDISAHFNICTFYEAKEVFPLKNASLESDLSDSSGTFILLCLFFG